MKSAWFWLAGGVLIGIAIMFMLGAFGDTGFGLMTDGVQVPAASNYAQFCYDASLDVSLTTNGKLSILFLFLGLGCLVGANATAWRDTEGY